jgi:hypothetical protein
MEVLNLQSSQLSTLMECPRKWYYQYHLWRGVPASGPMVKGTTFHLLGELHLKQGVELDHLHEAVKAHPQAKELLPYFFEAYQGYLDWYARYKDDQWQLFEIDGKPSIEVEFKLELASNIFFWGKFDQLRTNGHKTCIFDWKVTSAALTEYFFRKFELSCQTFAYSFAGKAFFPDMDGFFIDGVQLKDGKQDFQRRYFPLVPALDEFVAETTRLGNWILEHIHNENFFEHRWTGCINKYNRKCEFADVCLASPHRRKALLMSDLFVDNKPIYDF